MDYLYQQFPQHRSAISEFLKKHHSNFNKLDDLLALQSIDFAPVYERLNHGPHYVPGDVLQQDQVLHRGTGSYHRAKTT